MQSGAMPHAVPKVRPNDPKAEFRTTISLDIRPQDAREALPDLSRKGL